MRESITRSCASRALAGRLAVLGVLACAGLSIGCARPEAPFHPIAHRGASAYAPENTLSSLGHALAIGATHVEFDVQLSRDGHVVLFHDRSLTEKTGASGSASDHDLVTLRALDLAPWFRTTHPGASVPEGATTIPTLREALELVGEGPFLHVELKSGDVELPAKVMAEIRRLGLGDRVRVTSFRVEQLERVRALDPRIRIGLLVRPTRQLVEKGEAPEGLRRRWLEKARARGFDQVAYPAAELDPTFVAWARGQGMDVRAWRVPSLDLMGHAVRSGASGATVDWPDRAMEWLRENAPERVPVEAR